MAGAVLRGKCVRVKALLATGCTESYQRLTNMHQELWSLGSTGQNTVTRLVLVCLVFWACCVLLKT